MAYVPGMPSSVYNNLSDKKKQEVNKAVENSNKKREEKRTSASSSVPGLPSNVPSSVKQKAQEIYNSQQETRISTSTTVPGLPSNVPTQVKKKAQQIYNNGEYLNSLPTQPSLLTPDARNILRTTNTYQAANHLLEYADPSKNVTKWETVTTPKKLLEVIPTSDRTKIKAGYSKDGTTKNAAFYSKVVSAINAQEAEYQQRTLDELANKHFWSADEKLLVSSATTQDYYKMQKNGYNVVYIEDGNGKLANKGGVFSIGRNKLSGIPSDVRVVLVDNDGNWRYVANSGDKANRMEAIRVQQAALTARMETKMNIALSQANTAKAQMEIIGKEIEELDKIADKSRKQSDFDALQNAIERYNKFYTSYKDANNRLSDLGSTWATTYNMYEKHLHTDVAKWTVEDEARYQELSEYFARSERAGISAKNNSIRNNVKDSNVASMLATDSQKLAEYYALSKRREENKDNPVILNIDSINAMNRTADAMKKAIDEFNKWDSVTIHTENGEDIGRLAKEFMGIEFDVQNYGRGYNTARAVATALTGGDTTKAIPLAEALTVGYKALTDKEERKHLVDIFKGIGSATAKMVAPVAVANAEIKKSQKYIAMANAKIKNGRLTPEERAAEQLKINGYLSAQHNAVKQAGTLMLNNTLSNLSVFDTTSFENAFVAWRMASHPDRYADDPKFQKMKEAYKAIYGEDYNGAMDAAHMAKAMIDVKTGYAGDDYIYIDSSDLRHKNGEQYGTAEAILVGSLTDIDTLLSLGEAAIGTTAKQLGKKAFTEMATEAYVEALVKSDIPEDTAREFVKSKAIQDSIKKDVIKALRETTKEGGDDIAKVMSDLLDAKASTLKDITADNIIKGLDEAHYAKFLDDASKAIAEYGDDFVSKALFVQKGTVIANTLGSLDEVIDKTQKALFKITCPVAGAISGMRKGVGYISKLVNLKHADPKTVELITATTDSVLAKASNANFELCLDGSKLKAFQNGLLDEFYAGVLGASKNDAVMNAIAKRFSQYSDGIMHNIANSYVHKVINTFDDALKSHKAIEALEELAQKSNFKSFDEMLSTVKENISIMYEHSPEARGIVDAFEKRYNRRVTYYKVGAIKKYIDNIDAHIRYNTEFGNKYVDKLFTAENIKNSPELVQSAAHEISNNVQNFLSTTDPELMRFTDAEGNLRTLHETGSALIDALNKVADGDFSKDTLEEAKLAVQAYADDLKHPYKANVEAFKQNVLFDAFGQQDYLQNIEVIAPNFKKKAQRKTIDSIQTSLMDYFTSKNIDFSKSDLDKILIESDAAKDFQKLSLEDQQNIVYRIIVNKGTNTINQISDAELSKAVSEITDCNSSLNKTIMLLSEASPEVSARIHQGMDVALATECTKIVYNSLKLDKVDSDLAMGIMDVMSGSSSYINKIIQLNPSDIGASKATDFIIDEFKKQRALHNGTYSTFRHLGCDTVDVAANIDNIATNIGDYIPEDDKYLDVIVSAVKSTDNAAPKDIAFKVRGSEDAAAVFRKDTRFTAYDSDFTSRAYGKTAQQLTDEYAALGKLDTMDSITWQNSIKNTIESYKQIALEQNKTIRLIGFNSSDAITGGNRYFSDVLRSCGVSVNMSNVIDLADIMRGSIGEYIFDSADINALRRGLQDAIDNAKAKSIALDITPSIAYDSKYNCADIISNALGKHAFKNKTYAEHAKYVKDGLDKITQRIGTTAYNEVGDALGAYLDATAFARKLEDAGLSANHARGELMKIITEATTNGKSQLGLNKIIDDTLDNEWLDYSKVDAELIDTFINRETVHNAVLQINNIHNEVHRLDLFTDSDKDNLLNIYKELTMQTPKNTVGAAVVQLAKVDELSVQQLYAVNRWLVDQLGTTMEPKAFKKMFADLLLTYGKDASYLTDTGYKFIRDNIVDYTGRAADAFLTKFLDDTEEGYAFSQALATLHNFDETKGNLEAYMESVEGLFKKYDVHGEQDKLMLMQVAAVHDPIRHFQNSIMSKYTREYKKALDALFDEASKLYGKGNAYNVEMAKRVATNKAVAATKEYLTNYGNNMRKQAVRSIVDAPIDAVRTHLIRNCCGGLIIDPSSMTVKGIDLTVLLDKWQKGGLGVDTINFSSGAIRNRQLIRVYVPELKGADMDAVFSKYDVAHVKFTNAIADNFNNNMRHASFNASDMTLVNASHIDNFRNLFFNDGVTDILDLNANFRSWRNELYSCNMWTDSDIKQLVNPYYSDNILSNLAQSTHQLRDNLAAVHDLGSVMNNRYMNTEYILGQAGVLKPTSLTPISAQRATILQQITTQNQRVCKIVADKNNKFKIVDYTDRLKKVSTTDEQFHNILKNTILLDDGFYNEVSDWAKYTTIALRLQTSNAPEWLSVAYQTYKKTIRSGTIATYLYGSRGTGFRNATDSSSKGLFEVMQYGEDTLSYMQKYADAIKDVTKYAELSGYIEDRFGRVNRENINKWFDEYFEGANKKAALDKFNLIYGYEHTCGGDSLIRDGALKQVRASKANALAETLKIDTQSADIIRKEFDRAYSSPKFYGMTNAQLQKHLVEIHNNAIDNLLNNKEFMKNVDMRAISKDALSKAFYDYEPTVVSWGELLTQFPVFRGNKKFFDNAEVRARLAVYETFLEGGSSEAEAMKHVTATQFNYAGIGKVEDFMPFTQYKLYNALYWFDHANSAALHTAWRFAQYNGDGYSTNKEIADLCTKYRTRDYYLYDAGTDSAYDEYYNRNLSFAEHIFLDGVDSYLGVPRTFNAGNIDLNGTHYLKFGNSFVEELDLVTTLAAGTALFAMNVGTNIELGKDLPEKINNAYEAFKYTPLYDSLYSPWKSYIDLMQYSYNKRKTTLTSKDIWDDYEDFMANKGTHSEAIAALPVAGAILSNLVGRTKSFDLNLGNIAALMLDPDAKNQMGKFLYDLLLDTTGALVPSLIGTKVEPDTNYSTYGYNLTKRYLPNNPTTYFDTLGRLQKMGFTPEQAQEICDSMQEEWDKGSYMSKEQYYDVARNLLARGYTVAEITNLFAQHGIKSVDNKRYLAMYNALPGYIKYDPDMRKQIIDYYKSMGMSTDAAWAYLLEHPVIMDHGRIIELSPTDVALLNKRQSNTYWALNSNSLTDEEWDAYWASMPYRYPKGKWSETYHYLTDAGYSAEAARAMLLHGYMLDANGRLVDVQGYARARTFAYFDFNHPLGYENFNAYYQTLPDYTKYEKGAFSRTYHTLKALGFDYESCYKLIQQGAYLMDVTSAQGLALSLNANRNPANANIPVTDVASLVQKYNGEIIKGADGKSYIIIDCSGLQRARKTYRYTGGGYSRRSYSGGGYSKRNWNSYSKTRKVKPRYAQYYTRKPYVLNGNVSSYAGFTGYRGKAPDKLTKPYTSKGYVSTYSQQNFLNGASYGMRKAYKIDMRQFKSGALSTKSAYPASYRNVAVAYRRNLYKDLYAKYGMARMRMRANMQGYSNAAITRLRRNEIYNRERYAERRDRKANEKVKLRAAR